MVLATVNAGSSGSLWMGAAGVPSLEVSIAGVSKRVLGKDEVTSSILVNGSSFFPDSSSNSCSESVQKANSLWQRKNSIAASRT